MTEEEQEREIKNINLFRFLDLMSILVLSYVHYQGDMCQKPFMPFYYANGAWSLISITVLTWYTNT
jgi:hypothetical protein